MARAEPHSYTRIETVDPHIPFTLHEHEDNDCDAQAGTEGR